MSSQDIARRQRARSATNGNGRPGGLGHYPQNQDVGAANRQFSAIDNIGEKSGLANLGGSPASSENENPGASGNATGADNNDLAITSEEYRLRAEHARTLCYAISNCDPRDACWIMAAALDDLSAGMPGAPLFSFMHEANWWADWASEPELKAYLWACWQRLSPAARASFLRYIERGAAA